MQWTELRRRELAFVESKLAAPEAAYQAQDSGVVDAAEGPDDVEESEVFAQLAADTLGPTRRRCRHELGQCDNVTNIGRLRYEFVGTVGHGVVA